MKASKQLPPLVLIASLVNRGIAATITNTLDSVPSQVQCNDLWTNQNVVLHFTETIASEDGAGGYCSFRVDPGFVWLFPSRLHLDFGLLQGAITRVEVDIDDDCGSGCTTLFAYNAGSQIGSIGNTTTQPQTLSLTFNGLYPERCAIRSFEGKVDEIRIFIEDPPVIAIQKTNGLAAMSWPTNAGPYSLERTGSLAGTPAWATETNNIQIEGSNFIYRASVAAGIQFYRLRRN